MRPSPCLKPFLLSLFLTPLTAHPLPRSSNGLVWSCESPYQTSRGSSNCKLVADNVFDSQNYIPACRPYISPPPQTVVPESPDILCRVYNDPKCLGDVWAPIEYPGMFNLEPDWVLGIVCYSCRGEVGGCKGAPYWVDTPMFSLPQLGLGPPL